MLNITAEYMDFTSFYQHKFQNGEGNVCLVLMRGWLCRGRKLVMVVVVCKYVDGEDNNDDSLHFVCQTSVQSPTCHWKFKKEHFPFGRYRSCLSHLHKFPTS